MALTIDECKKLKSLAHHLKPVVQVGHQGVTESLITAVDRALTDHELIKVKFMDYKKEKRELSGDISAQTGCEIVTIIGNVTVLYRQSPDEKKRKNLI